MWKALLYGLQVITINPRGITHSEEYNKIMKKHRLDRYMTSAYPIALRFRRRLKNLKRP